MTRPAQYDCSRCPAYCCSYPRIEVSPADVERLAAHFGLPVDAAQRRFTRVWSPGERVLRHRPDDVYQSVCRFLDPELRRCTVYEARPEVCRQYPDGRTCGYWQFLVFERRHQGDDAFIPSA